MSDDPSRPSVSLFDGFEVTAADTVVDVGCGPGGACRAAGLAGADVIGIDINPDEIERAERTMAGSPARSFRAIVGDSNPIPLADGTASAVIATEVMEHVDDPERFLAEMVRIGRPGARYLISVPDPASESLMKAVAPAWYFEPPFHQHIYEHDRLDAMLRAAGLTIERRSYCGFRDSIWWALRMASGSDAAPNLPETFPPILADWERVWAAIKQVPAAEAFVAALDRAIPKSQVLICRKPGAAVDSTRSRLRRLLRLGRAA